MHPNPTRSCFVRTGTRQGREWRRAVRGRGRNRYLHGRFRVHRQFRQEQGARTCIVRRGVHKDQPRRELRREEGCCRPQQGSVSFYRTAATPGLKSRLSLGGVTGGENNHTLVSVYLAWGWRPDVNVLLE